MIVIYKGEELAREAPKEMMIGDTLIIDNKAYEIYTKTYDFDNSLLYCKVEKYEEAQSAINIINKIYNSNDFISSGFNTNNIEQHPRLITALTVIAVIVGDEHMDKMGLEYRKNIISAWGQKSILWSDILNDNPTAKMTDLNLIKEICISLLKQYKIAPSVWPDFLK